MADSVEVQTPTTLNITDTTHSMHDREAGLTSGLFLALRKEKGFIAFCNV
jgi:hypothetical protein